MNEKKKISAGAVAGSSIITFFITVFFLASTLLLMVNRITSEKELTKLAQSVKVSDIEMKVEFNGNEYDNLNDAILANLASDNRDNVSNKDLDKFINDSQLADFVANKITDGIESLIDGDSDDTSLITADEIIDFLEEHEKELEKDLDCELDSKVIDDIRTGLEENNIEDTYTIGYLKENISSSFDFSLLKYVFSNEAYFIIAGGYAVGILLWVAVIFLNKRRMAYAGTYLGSSAIAVGTVVTLMAVAVKVLSGIVLDSSLDFVKNGAALTLAYSILTYGFIILAAGGFITVLCHYIKRDFFGEVKADNGDAFVKIIVTAIAAVVLIAVLFVGAILLGNQNIL